MSKYNTTPIEIRFWSKVNKCGAIPEHCPELGVCWEWLMHRDKHGYGKFKRHGNGEMSHRMAWELTNGSIPDGLWVLHKCDNPSCVNPTHLFLGTPKDNVIDRENKQRGNRGTGENSRHHTLTASQVYEIRQRYTNDPNVSYRSLGREFGVRHSTIGRIIRGDNWKEQVDNKR
jgi:hypothetical protein